MLICPLCWQVWLLRSFSDQQRTALLAACHAVVYTPQREHFGIVPLEAMASSRPVIACNSGGPMESVLHGKTGFLCEPSPEQFAAAMATLLVRVCPAAGACLMLVPVSSCLLIWQIFADHSAWERPAAQRLLAT